MFSSHLRESYDNRVSFNDMSNAALAQIINFIYTGQAEINYENAQDLLAAASLLQYYEVCLSWAVANVLIIYFII